MNAHNLAMVALTSRMQHEFIIATNNCKKKIETPQYRSQQRRDEMDHGFLRQSLREIVIGMGGKSTAL